jgi:hypothetical protein
MLFERDRRSGLKLGASYRLIGLIIRRRSHMKITATVRVQERHEVEDGEEGGRRASRRGRREGDGPSG